MSLACEVVWLTSWLFLRIDESRNVVWVNAHWWWWCWQALVLRLIISLSGAYVPFCTARQGWDFRFKGLRHGVYFLRTHWRHYFGFTLIGRNGWHVHLVLVGCGYLGRVALHSQLILAARTVAPAGVYYDRASRTEVTLADEGVELEFLFANGVGAACGARVLSLEKVKVLVGLQIVFVQRLKTDLFLAVLKNAIEVALFPLKIVNTFCEELVVVDYIFQFVIVGDLLLVAVHTDVLFCVLVLRDAQEHFVVGKYLVFTARQL